MGSEMCIRDRLGADLVPVAIAVLAGPVIMAVLRRVKKLFL